MNSDLKLAEYDDRTQAEIEIDTYRQLEWLRIWKSRKVWWMRIFYRSLFGKLPEEWMQTLEPMEPSAAMLALVRRRDNAYKREKRAEDERRRGANGRDKISRRVEETAGTGGDDRGDCDVEG